MHRVDDNHRVLGLVAVVVTSGLLVAGFANGSSTLDGRAANFVAQETGPVRPEIRSTAEAPAMPARNVRVVYSGPLVTARGDSVARPAAAPDLPARSPAPRPQAPEVDVTGSISPVRPAAPVQLASVDPSAPIVAPPGADHAAKLGLDLNTASIDELNSLAGGGRIGKAIARGRPYASPEDLVTKRVLNRATYARIRDQVTVR
jgi:hypothetical protein